MPLRIEVGVFGSPFEDYANAIDYAWQNGADVISNSWSTSLIVPVIEEAIRRATTQGRGGVLGSVVCFSAGNTAQHSQGQAGEVHFPANVDIAGVLTVAASDRDDRQADYSPTSTLIDIAAPSHRAQPYEGSYEKHEVWSTDIPGDPGRNPGKDDYLGEVLPNSGTNYLAYTGRFGGTSAACPMVAGIAALVLSQRPGLTQLQVFDLLTKTADKVGGYTYTFIPGFQDPAHGHSNELGYGRVNARKALQRVWLITPDGGNLLPKGQDLSIQWGTDDPALTKVDLSLSTNGGQSFSSPFASGQPNTGQYTYPGGIGTLGSQYRIRVKCYDPGNASNYAIDDSDANFTVWGIDETHVQETISHFCSGGSPQVPRVRFDISWPTAAATDGTNLIATDFSDSLKVYAPGHYCPGATTGVAGASVPTPNPSSQHRLVVEANCTIGYWTYVLKSTKLGSGSTVSYCRTIWVYGCVSCNGHCKPPCQYESGDELAQPEHPVLRTFLGQGKSNPATGGLTIEFGLEQPLPVSLRVYDVTGHRVRNLVEGGRGAGIHQAIWDSRDDQGQSVAAGIYIAKLRAGEKVLTQKLVVAR